MLLVLLLLLLSLGHGFSERPLLGLVLSDTTIQKWQEENNAVSRLNQSSTLTRSDHRLYVQYASSAVCLHEFPSEASISVLSRKSSNKCCTGVVVVYGPTAYPSLFSKTIECV